MKYSTIEAYYAKQREKALARHRDTPTTSQIKRRVLRSMVVAASIFVGVIIFALAVAIRSMRHHSKVQVQVSNKK